MKARRPNIEGDHACGRRGRSLYQSGGGGWSEWSEPTPPVNLPGGVRHLRGRCISPTRRPTRDAGRSEERANPCFTGTAALAPRHCRCLIQAASAALLACGGRPPRQPWYSSAAQVDFRPQGRPTVAGGAASEARQPPVHIAAKPLPCCRRRAPSVSEWAFCAHRTCDHSRLTVQLPAAARSEVRANRCFT